MTTAGLVLDADAIKAYARGSVHVGELMVRVTEQDGEIFVPALCLTEAYRTAEGIEHDLLALLSPHRQVIVLPLEEADCWVVGGWSRKIGSLHLAHAAVETAARPLVPLVTAHRDRVTRHLAQEWPIIDL